jgi:peptidoglycan/xylan/chitin deacetylase (PgdA/CDA1 family)
MIARTRLGRLLPAGVTDRLRLAVAAARGVLLTLSRRPVGVVLLYHRLEEQAGDPRRELVPAVAAREFRLQLRWLTRLFRVVPAASILDAAAGRRRGRRLPVAITFDDEWPTHASLALPALRDAGATATFFLTGAHLQRRTPFWWESLQHAVDAGLALQGAVSAGTVFEQAVEITDADAATRASVSARLRDITGAGARSGMTPAEVRLLAQEATVGFHTLRHDTLTALPDEALEAALRDGREDLERATGAPLRLIAYPHGAAGEREASAAQRAGFALGFSAEPEACGSWSDPFLIGRVEPGVVPIGAFLRIITGALRNG